MSAGTNPSELPKPYAPFASLERELDKLDLGPNNTRPLLDSGAKAYVWELERRLEDAERWDGMA